MFERPTKNDLDRSLSLLMHDNRHKLIEACNLIKSDAIKVGALQGNRVIVTAVKAADSLHKDAMKQATAILLDFIERMKRPPAEIVGWGRPHLENLGNSLLGVVPANNLPQDHQRLTQQYHTVFQQRLDDVLRDVEIGFVKGAGFARAEKVESKEEWITPSHALELLQFTLGHGAATNAICTRAHDGMIRARAARYIEGCQVADSAEIPVKFWWARGKPALTQNWKTGDFETWIDQRIHLKAYGVRFLRSDIEQMIPDDDRLARSRGPAAPTLDRAHSTTSKGGRYPAEFWDDLWVEIARQLFEGDLKPKKQADIENAMMDWLASRGDTPGVTTIRERARKLWQAIKDGN